MSRPPHPHLRRWIALLAVALMVAAAGPARAQDDLRQQRAETQSRLESLKDQIQRDQTRLQEAAEKEQASRDRLNQIKREIALREELVSTYETRMRQLRQERGTLRDTLDVLEGRLDELRREYRVHAEHAYKYGRLHDLALILAANSINQMLVRIRYLHRFADQRRSQRSQIQNAAERLVARRNELEASEKRTEQLLAEARTERQNLQRLQSDRRSVVAELRTQRSELKEEIRRKEEAARELETRVRELIAKVEARERRNAGSSESSAPARAAAYARLSASFQSNQGSLPWPADGAVTEKFGNRVDPVHGTTTYHPGILIATNPGAAVRAVFSGTVTGIDFVPGYGTYLVVRHGDYLSVYSNFSSLTVSTGESVSTGQPLGRAGTDDEPRGSGIFFAVFDKTKNESVDPIAWLDDR